VNTVILAGGKGERLWPLSREQFPKQFIKLLDDKSLFQKTVERAMIFSDADEIYIVTNEEYRFRVLDQLSELGVEVPEENILFEPYTRNTLPAIYYATKTILKKNNDSVVAVLPSDHIVDVNDSYKKAFENAEYLAENYIVTFGIKPTHPHTGYGYIKPGKHMGGGFVVEEFIEKPRLDKAKEYFKKGLFWNSGMFVFKASVFVEECKKLQPDVVKAFETKSLKEAYEKIPAVSLDYGIMEKTDKAVVVPIDTFWSDVGSFESLYSIMSKDNDGNAINGDSDFR